MIRNVHNEEIHLTQKIEWHMKLHFLSRLESLSRVSTPNLSSRYRQNLKTFSIAEKGELAEDYGILDNSPTITLIVQINKLE